MTVCQMVVSEVENSRQGGDWGVGVRKGLQRPQGREGTKPRRDARGVRTAEPVWRLRPEHAAVFGVVGTVDEDGR